MPYGVGFIPQSKKINDIQVHAMNSPTPLAQQPSSAVYQLLNGLSIVPFYDKDGTSSFSDTFLAQVFRRIVREESVSKIFYDGSIQNSAEFIRFAKNRENEIFFVGYDGRDAGFFWLNRFRRKAAFITYCLYKDFWGDEGLLISRKCIDFLFARKDDHGEHRLDVLLGLTPANNKLAIKFLLKNGMTVSGKVPGLLYDAGAEAPADGIFSYIQRNKSASLLKMPSIFFVH
jgi:hypothetical protein